MENEIKSIIISYEKLVYKICIDIVRNKENSENLVQETFIAFYLNIDKYISLPQDQIKKVICKIALNKCRDFLKSKKENILLNAATLEEQEIVACENIEMDCIEKEKQKLLRKAVEELKEPYKTVIITYYIEDNSLDETARILKINKPTLKVQLTRAKEMLRNKMLKMGGDYYV